LTTQQSYRLCQVVLITNRAKPNDQHSRSNCRIEGLNSALQPARKSDPISRRHGLDKPG
jgi:phosphatidate phosphatase APP1